MIYKRDVFFFRGMTTLCVFSSYIHTMKKTQRPRVARAEKTWFEKGDKIIYHRLSKNKTTIAKTGVFIRFVKKRGLSPYDWQANKRAVVKLDGNKNTSTIWESEMRHLRQDKEDMRFLESLMKIKGIKHDPKFKGIKHDPKFKDS